MDEGIEKVVLCCYKIDIRSVEHFVLEVGDDGTVIIMLQIYSQLKMFSKMKNKTHINISQHKDNEQTKMKGSTHVFRAEWRNYKMCFDGVYNILSILNNCCY